MTIHRYYAAVTQADNGKYFAFVIPFTSSDNAMYVFHPAKHNLIFANIYTSRKEAEEVARTWNESYRANGTNLF